MNVIRAASATFSSYCHGFDPEAQVKPEKDNSGKTVGHALWMLDGIISGYAQKEKAHRWLGYAQALLVCHDAVSLDECKIANKQS